MVRLSFWSINGGLMLMVVLDLFPAGALQFQSVLDNGLWFARSEAFIGSPLFESLTWMRGIGATLFLIGGVIPLTWFITTRSTSLKSSKTEYSDFDRNL